jgi:hypothetical protein
LNNVDVENDLLDKKVLPSALHNLYFSKYVKSSQMVLQLFNCEPCFGDFELDGNKEMYQIKPKEE